MTYYKDFYVYNRPRVTKECLPYYILYFVFSADFRSPLMFLIYALAIV